MGFIQGWIAILLLSIAILIILLSFNPTPPDTKYAQKIRDCFKDVRWDRQVFWNGSSRMESEHGETKFYGCNTIDKAIAKLNKVLRQIPIEAIDRLTMIEKEEAQRHRVKKAKQKINAKGKTENE